MSKLVRARARNHDEWPEWAKCNCGERPQYLPFDVDVSDTGVSAATNCKCGNILQSPKRFKAVRIVTGPLTGRLTPFELLDLDEVPAELQSDKYVDSLEIADKTA